MRTGIPEPQALDTGVGKVIQHKPHLTTTHRVCAWDRAAQKATIRPEFSWSALPRDGVGLEICSVSCSWWLAASSRKPGQAVCLPCTGRRAAMTQGWQKRLPYFSPALPGGCEAEAGEGLSSPELVVPHSACSSSSSQAQCGCFSMPRQGARVQWDSAAGILQSQHEPVM